MSVKVTVTLPSDQIEAVRRIAERRGISMTEVLRRALALEKFIQDATGRGDTILIETPIGVRRLQTP